MPDRSSIYRLPLVWLLDIAAWQHVMNEKWRGEQSSVKQLHGQPVTQSVDASIWWPLQFLVRMSYILSISADERVNLLVTRPWESGTICINYVRVVTTYNTSMLQYHIGLHASTRYQCSRISWKSCWSWSEFWEVQTLICKEMCKKLLVLTKSCRSRTDGLALVSNTAQYTVKPVPHSPIFGSIHQLPAYGDIPDSALETKRL